MRPMRPRHWVILVLLAGQIPICGCKGGMGDWWRRHKEEPGAQTGGTSPRPADEPADEDLLDEIMSDKGSSGQDDAAFPSTGPSSRPSSAPADRNEWSKARKSTTTKPPRSRAKAADSIQTPILFVNDDVITIQEVLDPIRSQLEKAASEMSRPEYNRFLVNLTKARVIRLIREYLAYGEAKKEITEEMEPAVTKAVDDTERSRINAEFGGRFSRYQAYLQANGLKRSDVRRQIRRGLVVKQYLKDTFLPLIRPPTRQQLLKYYQRHSDEFSEPLRVEMFLIDVPYWHFLEGGSAKDRQARWAKLRGRRRIEARRAATRHMDQARQELASGIPFDAVAQTYSFGPNKKKGGAWGAVSPGGLTGRWGEAAKILFELEEGQVSDVIRTEEGLLLVKAGKRFERRLVPFVEAQPIIEKKLVRRQETKLESDLLSKLWSKATIGDVESFLTALYKKVPEHPDARKSFKLRSNVR